MEAQTKKIMVKYFPECADMYRFLDEHSEYKMVKYNFTFAYGYCLQYAEK